MRRIVCLGCMLFLLGAALAGKGQEASQGPAAVLDEEEQRLMQAAIQDGRAVPPERIVESVRAFLGRPDCDVKVFDFGDEGDVGFEGTYYSARIDEGPGSEATGKYECRAADGRVFDISLPRNSDKTVPPIVDEAQAHELARQFLFQKCPEFAARQWAEDYEWSNDPRPDEFEFNWREILNEHGTRAVFDLRVSVEKSTGRIVHYQFPPDRVAGPVVPGITLEDAKILAAEHAAYDPALVPFGPCFPKLMEDPEGIQSLWWELHQPVQEEGEIGVRDVCVEALTGAEIIRPPSPFGEAPAKGDGTEPWRVPLRKKSLARIRKLAARWKVPEPAARVSRADGLPLTGSVAPVVRGERVWLRAELLRILEVRPYTISKGLLLRYGSRRVMGADVGARFRDYGWWVPLRSVAQAYGWRLEWKNREAVVHVPPRT